MWLKSLRLLNFQKHTDLTLDFTQGVNVIYGSSDAGKSCIRRAIAWLYDLESYNEETIRKEGSKKTSVIGVFDNGIEIERIRSSSINRYVSRVPGQKEMEYDSVGKGMPDEVRKLVRMTLVEIDDKNKLNLNIAEQISLPFLSDISASSRLKLFNKITGNDLLDILNQNFNKEIVGIRRSLTVENNVVKENEPKITQLDQEIKNKQEVVSLVDKKLKNIEENHSKLLKLKDLQVNMCAVRMAVKCTTRDLETLKVGDETKIASLKEQNTRFSALNTLKESINRVKSSLDVVRGDLAKLRVPGLDSAVLRGQIEKVAKLSSIMEQIKGLKGKINICITEHAVLQQKIPTQEQEWQNLIKEAKICPVCHQDTSKCEVHL